MKFSSDWAHAAWRSARRFFLDALVEVDEFACEDLEGLGAHELVLGVGEQQRDGGGGAGGLIGEELLMRLVKSVSPSSMSFSARAKSPALAARMALTNALRAEPTLEMIWKAMSSRSCMVVSFLSGTDGTRRQAGAVGAARLH